MLRKIAILTILTAGMCTTAMNWRFSYQLGTSSFDSCTWAIFSVALDISKWLMLPYAALAWHNNKARSCAAFSIWLIATVYSFTAAMGFAALNRGVASAAHRQQAELHATLATIKLSPKWQSSAACADATTPQSKEFCAYYRTVASQIRELPQDADPQANFVARLTGLQPETVSLILSVFLALACEIISAFGFFAILPSPLPAKTPQAAHSWAPRERRLETTSTDGGAIQAQWRPPQKWKSPR
jgi:hypothetical protein